MAKTKDVIKQVCELIETIYGPKARRVFEYLVEKNTFVPEENIGRELGLKSNEARKILQTLAEEGFISFRRSTSKEKGHHGWYVNYSNLEGVIIARLKKSLEKLRARMEYEEQTNIYYCPNDGTRYSIEEAIVNDFMCPQCGSLLEEYDGRRAAEFLREKISSIERALKSIGVL